MPSAGQVEQFSYCAHNWWLARHGEEGKGQGSQRGLRDHSKLGEAQRDIEQGKRHEKEDFGLAMRMVGLAASIALLVVTVILAQNLSWQRQLTLAILGLVVVSASAALLVFGLIARQRYLAKQKESRIVPGELIATDLAGRTALMTDPSWDLQGRPDYLLSTHEGPVPVEVKTGHTPQRPYESHTLQLACYLRLLQVQEGKAPAYGVLQYPDGVFRVNWDPALEAKLRATLDRMAQAERDGKADRDHEQAGRCRGCSRRAVCDQRLA